MLFQLVAWSALVVVAARVTLPRRRRAARPAVDDPSVVVDLTAPLPAPVAE
jgi:hypothetical protein